MTRTLSIPTPSLVVLVGPSGAGKSTLARRLFAPTEILSSDALRAMVRDDENDMGATNDAFEVLHLVLEKRLAAGRLTVVDATNVRQGDRAGLVAMAKRHHVTPVAIVLDVGLDACLRHNATRQHRGEASTPYVTSQHESLRRAIPEGASDVAHPLKREGFRVVHVLHDEAEHASVTLTRTKLDVDRRELQGPFDIIGDVHGCLDELTQLLARLGYAPSDGVWSHPSRTALFLGDLVDRGPASIGSLKLAQAMVERGHALMVPGNHEARLERALAGKNVKRTHGFDLTMAELESMSGPERRVTEASLASFLHTLPSHLVLDGGELVVAHAGMKQSLQGRDSGTVKAFAHYGDTTGETDAYGLPVRLDWARDYTGDAVVVYGHTPVLEAEWVNGTICIDTGCVFGGRLTALRWPERELVQVPAARRYAEPARPLSG
ncbi:MAG: AAA family ATPase [Deltaproteobacteria bacterium]|nr:AAA family ATPase [Deltaproteobacteria bacterium]